MSCDGILGGVKKKTNTHLPTNGTMWMTGQFASVILIDGALCYLSLKHSRHHCPSGVAFTM